MAWFNELYADFVLPALQKERFSNIATQRRIYERRESLSLSENLDLQWQALQRVLRHAYDSTPFYRDRFNAAGVTPETIHSPADLLRIPVLTRKDIQQHFSELQSRKYQRSELREAATGGTTDTPVPLLRDVNCLQERTAVQLRFNSWAGLQPGDKVFWLWGARVDYPQNPSWRWRLFDRYVMRRVWAPTSRLNDEILSEYVTKWNSFRAKCIMAYPTPLAFFCEYLLRCGKDYHRPQTAICTAEPLTAEQRLTIDKALECRVFEHYGTRDFGLVCAECNQHDGMHYNPAAVYFEFLPMSSSSDLRELVVTDLLNYGFPMIRYQINDCALQGDRECPCGRGYPTIREISGRTTDNFYLSNGDIVPGVSFTNRIIKVCPGLAKLQVIQEEPANFHVKYVPGVIDVSSDIETLRDQMKRFLGSNAVITFSQVDEIPREASGKTRFCISRVSREMAGVHLVGK